MTDFQYVVKCVTIAEDGVTPTPEEKKELTVDDLQNMEPGQSFSPEEEAMMKRLGVQLAMEGDYESLYKYHIINNLF